MVTNTPIMATIYHDHELFGDNREKAILRDGEKCVKCGMTREEHKKKYNKDLAVDHINGLGKGVSRDKKDNRLENLQTFCWRCHAIKEAKNKDLKAMAKLGGLAIKNKYGKEYYKKMAAHMNKKVRERKMENNYTVEKLGYELGRLQAQSIMAGDGRTKSNRGCVNTIRRIKRLFSSSVQEAKAEMITKIDLIKGRHKEEHICRFNDGECDCDCYLEGLDRVKRQLASLKQEEEK